MVARFGEVRPEHDVALRTRIARKQAGVDRLARRGDDPAAFDPTHRRGMGIAARADAEARYDSKANIRRTVELMKECL